MFAFIFFYGFINTLFITLNAEKNNKENEMADIFALNQVMDIFVYSVITIISKSFMFWAITNDEKVACWKRTLIFLIALLPYVSLVEFKISA